MVIRRYESGDLEQLVRLFFETVHAVNKEDYSVEQLNAWAPPRIDRVAWAISLCEHLTYVAVAEGRIVGFGDMDEPGYLDRLFVHKDFQRRGIATRLCDRLEGEVATARIVVHASLTARPFFAKRGYGIVREAVAERQGVPLPYFVMEKTVGNVGG